MSGGADRAAARGHGVCEQCSRESPAGGGEAGQRGEGTGGERGGLQQTAGTTGPEHSHIQGALSPGGQAEPESH